MPELDTITTGGVTYDIKDSYARSHLISLPNYSAGTSYSTNTYITVPSNGWFWFNQDTGNYSAASITIWAPGADPATDPYLAYGFYRNYNDSNNAIVPVPKDYIIYFTTSYGYTLTFYPCLGN